MSISVPRFAARVQTVFELLLCYLSASVSNLLRCQVLTMVWRRTSSLPLSKNPMQNIKDRKPITPKRPWTRQITCFGIRAGRLTHDVTWRYLWQYLPRKRTVIWLLGKNPKHWDSVRGCSLWFWDDSNLLMRNLTSLSSTRQKELRRPGKRKVHFPWNLGASIEATALHNEATKTNYMILNSAGDDSLKTCRDVICDSIQQ